jgi:hypothetical protein
MLVIQREEKSTSKKMYLHKPAEWCFDIKKAADFRSTKNAKNYIENNLKMFSKKEYEYTTQST